MDAGTLEIDGRTITISNRDKVLFPGGITKAQLIDYYCRIAPHALPYYHGRPLSMERYPDGVGSPGFFQKHVPDYFPDWISRAELRKEDGTVTYVVANDAATLAYIANQACITPHLALATIDRPDQPDRIVIDLDPSDDSFAKVQEAAAATRKALDRRGLDCFVQTTGSRGLHIMVPIAPDLHFDLVRDWVRAFAARLVEAAPSLMTLEMRKARRGDRVFVDYLRNAYGQTSVAPYAVRARAGAPVATPLRWDEALSPAMSPRKYTIRSIFRRLAQVADPWAGFMDSAGTIRT